jgi:hypothetical protein
LTAELYQCDNVDEFGLDKCSASFQLPRFLPHHAKTFVDKWTNRPFSSGFATICESPTIRRWPLPRKPVSRASRFTCSTKKVAEYAH